jgi:hypothetical protein
MVRPAPRWIRSGDWRSGGWRRGYDAAGQPRDRLWFVTAGGLPPLTADSDWEVILEATPQGLSLLARAVGANAPPRLLIGPADVTGLDVRVVSALTDEPGWSEIWDYPGRIPEAIELTYWTDDGPAAPPLRLTLPLGRLR